MLLEQELEKLLEKHGWVVECYSPFEIRHPDGSFASGQAADIVLHALIAGWCDDDQPLGGSKCD